MGNSFTYNRCDKSDDKCGVVDDNEFEYNHNIDNHYIVIDKIQKCQWKSITKWSDISSKDKKKGLKNRNYYSSSYENSGRISTC